MSKEEETENEHAMESRIVEIKLQKQKAKTKFTRNANKLKEELSDSHMDKALAKELLDNVEEAMDEAIKIIHELCDEYKTQGRTKEMTDSIKEIEKIENSYEVVVEIYNNAISDTSETSNASLNEKEEKSTKSQLDRDLSRQMKRVSIPIFSGRKQEYGFWKAAFTACIDKTDASPEYKLLQLRQYLKGEALKAIEGLGHSALAYEKAKERLDRKFGGERKRVNQFIEEIEKFPAIKYENSRSVEQFADLLDITLINLKELKEQDLHSNFLYQQLLRKLPENMISQFERWLFENSKDETIDMLNEWITKEAEFKVIAQEAKYGLEQKKEQRDRSFFTNEKRPAKSQRECKICKKTHAIWDCNVFSNLTPAERWDKAKELRLCFRCLRNNHVGNDCRNYRKCVIDGCGKVHHRLLHRSEKSGSAESRDTTAESRDTTKTFQSRHETLHNNSSQYIALRTVPVVLKYGNRTLKVNALLDDASTKTYVNANVAAELNLHGSQTEMSVRMLNNKVETFYTKSVTFEIQSIDGTLQKEIDAQTVKNVTGELKVIDWSKERIKYHHLQNIDFPPVPRKATVDILIGLDNADLHISRREITGNKGEPVARLTPLGWTCVGTVEAPEPNVYITFHVNDTGVDLTEFWNMESIGTKSQLSDKDQKILKTAESSIEYDSNFYKVSIPWKKNKTELTENYEAAVNRLVNLEKRLKKDNELNEVYRKTIEQYEKKGYVRRLTKEENDMKGWYLPHFPVVRSDKETTKVRLVFDASAKHNNISLNDVIYQGPKLQNDLNEILLKFRKHSVALVCDVAEMYLRVGLKECDQPYHRFLWRSSSEKPIEVYQFTRLVFGVNASPFLAQLVSQHNAVKFENLYPLASKTVNESTYMDDSMNSVESPIEAIEHYQQLNELWRKAGMHVRKWLSNSEEVLEIIPVEDRALQINLAKSELPSVKTLGQLWLAKEDQFSFRTDLTNTEMSLTKRNFLRKLASVFDPLGLIAPFILKAKVIMQEIWVSGIDWDEEVQPEIANKIRQWFDELHHLDMIRVPRCLQKENSENELIEMRVHTFVDASSIAYGGVVYTRSSYKDGSVTVRLVTAKGKVAPLEAVCIPRLELQAAVLGLKLTKKVNKALEMPMKNATFWSDSMNVLFWVRHQSRRMKTFVANRVGEIHRSTEPQQWRYVPSKENPADFISRGLTVTELSESAVWFEGPNFLKEDSELWPKNLIEAKIEATKELKQANYNIVHVESEDKESRLDPERFSSWYRLVRVFGWVVRFIENCQTSKAYREKGSLKAHEIQERENDIIRETQKEHFTEEYKRLSQNLNIQTNSKLLKLNPKIDSERLMRCDGRLALAECLPYNTKFPIILPRKSAVTKLIVKQFHEGNNHCGTNPVLSELSSRYWIIAAREVIREVENNCMECRRRKLKAGKQIMAPLPTLRVNLPLRAFANTAVDYGGPFITVQGRGRRREKRYLCLFTCLSTRAVHLEMAYSLDTNSFLNAFYRMVNRRGLPVKMLSDNGTNFVKADKELKQLVSELKDSEDQIVENTANKGVEWQFNPPLAPHWGGVHESLIKTAKRAIYGILKNADVTDEELTTAFTGAENLMNSRPLTYQSSNPSDCTPLTPNHFLFGQMGGQFAPQSVDETQYNLVKRWRRVQELVSHFWNRWLREWLPALNQRSKWNRETADIREGDIVIVINPEVPRGNWPLGRVSKVHTGRDGHVRAASVVVGGKELVRPIVKLCPLELNINNS